MDFTEKLRLHGRAEENRYFAELDRKLIDAMHEKQKHENEILKRIEAESLNLDSMVDAKSIRSLSPAGTLK
ncbi:hypothetical protein AB4152_00995 [Vibrio breoganii]|uniref:hypothetical protein n=2 Tax=Vibrio breoganii TaxID=553239 RepID=UPI0002D95691|nr:hypothetical protein [Vibrio breoganii]OCH71753.1 hypothetical protein A6D95_17845 [Vibrio breoganii]OEF82487.1 hypothetical protein B003_10645 [Vibrio breoganii 1C10]PMJ47037.1 hypothetical protein BCU21_08680 [Vibrio breoganii]PMK58437.1 hypothetical protein BCT97_08665 [Vibrio breoganii]PML18497.1 hypothetical protein BCT84_04380 [Vibrio breoganii]